MEEDQFEPSWELTTMTDAGNGKTVARSDRPFRALSLFVSPPPRHSKTNFQPHLSNFA
ncbi:hypothetical protein Pcac1_g9267 [Phytophthora cactorum]|nr:hypothetical protein Pcac1_g9267 [Phytophthora cactorum]